MADSFTEVSSQGWFSRIKDAIIGVFFGLILFVLGFPVLWFNEGKAVDNAKDLAEGRGAVVMVPGVDKVDPAHDGKLVHLSGRAETEDILEDPMFGVSLSAIRLEREVEMYQWVEESETETKKKVGGGKEKVTTYTYEKKWSSSLKRSNEFKKREGHENPSEMRYPAKSWKASDVKLGAFELPSDIVSQIRGADTVPIQEVPASLGSEARLVDGGIYVGQGDPQGPRIGDTRVTLSAVPNKDISLIYQQSGNSFTPYKTRTGNTIEMVAMGKITAEKMFERQEQLNMMWLWGFRFIGWLMMMIGIGMLFNPFVVVADVIPFLGDILGAGVGLFAFAISAFCALMTIGVAWIFYRPLIGIPLVVLGIGIFAGAFMKARKS